MPIASGQGPNQPGLTSEVTKVPVDATLYLDLLEDSLLGVNVRRALVPLVDPVIRPFVQRQFERRGWIISRYSWIGPRDLDRIEKGKTRPEVGATMIGRRANAKHPRVRRERDR